MAHRRLEAALYVLSLSLLMAAAAARAADVPKEMQDDAQWTIPGKNYALTRYSALDQITTQNAKDLKAAWVFSLGVNRGQEAAPLVVGDRMYVVTSYPNILYCLQ